MKKSNCTYKKVAVKDLSPLATSLDPLNSNRLPIGVELTVEKSLVEVPASGTLTKPWQAVQLTDAKTDETYFTSPRVFLGLGFVAQKFTAVIERAFPKMALIDFIATEPKVIVTNYQDVEVDNFETKELEVKSMPVIVMAEAVEIPAKPKRTKA